MKNWVIQFVFFIICLICISACYNSEYHLCFNKSFDEIAAVAKDADLPFCIVLVDSSQILSKEYTVYLQRKHNSITHKAMFCVNDIHFSKEEWLFKWLCPVSLPLTCIFTPQEELIDLIPGTSIETISYIREAIKTNTTTSFHWPNRFKMDKKRVLPFLKSLLHSKECLNHGVYVAEEINKIIDSLPYPYSYYLKLTGALMKQDTNETRAVAISMLDLATPYVMDLYKNEFITAKTTLSKDYKTENDATIRVESDSICFENCKINENVLVNIDVYNTGKEPLIISKIHTSCSCLEQLDKKGVVTVNPEQSIRLKFNFKPDIEGYVSRDIFIASNGINMPIMHIKIVATVVQ